MIPSPLHRLRRPLTRTKRDIAPIARPAVATTLAVALGTAASLAAIMLVPAVLRAQDAASFLLPRPADERRTPDAAPFTLRSPVQIVVPRGDARLLEIGRWLGDIVRDRTGFRVRVTSGDVKRAPAGAITLDTAGFLRPTAPDGSAATEAYLLAVGEGSVRIRGASATAVIWGVQSWRQLLPPAFESSGSTRPAEWTIAAVTLHDAPRFAWRGSLLDVARHFFPVADVKRHIDLLSRYKLNVLHWHLTDDQGWRVQIRQLPRLTTIGAWHTEDTGERTGGFYTARDIRDVVEYARQRGVMVVPEIEMPGHARAAIAAYPALGCTPDSVTVATSWGVFADILCPSSPETFPTLFAVLDEVMALFPAPFIHVGGDEVPKNRWRDCPPCQALMRREGLPDEEALQGWFLRRIGGYLAAHGRTLIAWDEALDGGLDRASIVQSWRDSTRTRTAVARGHRVIASPSEWVYLNRSPAELTLGQVYAFDPVPAGLTSAERARIMGSEVTFWSEHITSGTNLDVMALPRLLAFADRLWGAPPPDLAALTERIERDHRGRLVAMGREMGPAAESLPAVQVAYDTLARKPRLRLTGTIPGLSVHRTGDGRRPSMASPRATDGQVIDDRGLVRLQAFVRGATLGEERRFTVERHLAVGAMSRVTPSPSASYPGSGPWALTDGLLGGPQHDDGLWVGWWGPDVEAVVDLGKRVSAPRVSIRFVQDAGSWILLPRQVELSSSNDGVQWTAPALLHYDVPATQDGVIVRAFAYLMPPAPMRFLRVVARNAGLLPVDHPGAGRPSWLFADEIVVQPLAGVIRP